MTRRQATKDDPLTPTQRRENMSRIRGRDTAPEMIVRKGLHARGLRFRLHCRGLPGSPDLVFASRHVVVFVHGCFWHGHDCALGVLPKTNAEFWRTKLARNEERDAQATSDLMMQRWRVATIWECAVRGKTRLSQDDIMDRLSVFIRSRRRTKSLEIAGRRPSDHA